MSSSGLQLRRPGNSSGSLLGLMLLETGLFDVFDYVHYSQ